MSSEKVALTTLFVCVVLFFFSLALFPVAVSTYCSKRHVAAILIGIQVALGAWAFAKKKASSNERTLSFASAFFALFGIALNFAFIIYATHLCHGTEEL
jgi:FtsH-binding integral membrane protein